MVLPRGGASGPFLVGPGKGNANWTAAAPLSITVLPAGHPAGLYSVDIAALVKAAAGAGTAQVQLSWDQPGYGAATFNIGTGSLTGVGASLLGAPRNLKSSGVSAITVVLTPAGVTGSPVVDVIAAATLLALSQV